MPLSTFTDHDLTQVPAEDLAHTIRRLQEDGHCIMAVDREMGLIRHRAGGPTVTYRINSMTVGAE